MIKLDNIQKQIWDKSAQIELPPPPDKEMVWMRLEQHMNISDTGAGMDQNQQRLVPPRSGIQSIFKPRLNYAIALGLAFVLSIPFVYNALNTVKIVTQYSDVQNIVLPDGSAMILNTESRVIYKKDFNSDHRNLSLNGEAFFEVKKGTIPFIINTDYGQVEVLGTSFNVRAREDGFEVGVNEGIVQVVSNQKTSVILEKGQIMDMDTDSDLLVSRTLSYKDYPDWKYKKLVCDQTPLHEVCSEIERTFGISFIFTDPSLSDITVTGVIDTQDLKTVLRTIRLLTRHEFKFDGGTCTII